MKLAPLDFDHFESDKKKSLKIERSYLKTTLPSLSGPREYWINIQNLKIFPDKCYRYVNHV